MRGALQAIAHSPYVLNKDIRLVAIDDAADPCPPHTVCALKAMGVGYRTTSFKRAGNLNGQECIMGILALFKQSIRRKSDVVVKMDCDTLLLGTTWLQQFLADKNALVTGSDDRGCLYGMCYALKPVLVDALIELFTRCPVGDRSQEDIYLGYRARRLALCLGGEGGYLPIPIWLHNADSPGDNGPHGQIIIYNWSRGPGIAHLYTGFQIVNVCNGMLKGATTMQNVRELINSLVRSKFPAS